MSPERRRRCVTHVRQRFGLSERQACRYLGQPRSTQRRPLVVQDDEEALCASIVRLASRYGRYGYRRITALLRAEGWRVNEVAPVFWTGCEERVLGLGKASFRGAGHD